MTFDELKEKAHALPLKPGVYIMQDAKNEVIYVGKAKALKNRVSQYFANLASHTEKTRAMVSQIDHFDVIVADSEFEALILENSLIKRHQPHYNILLKDDKGYPYIRLTVKEPYPRFSLANRAAEDGARYFGPYGSRGSTQNIIDALRVALKLPSCSRKFPRDIGKERPCLNYHMGQCDGYCRKEMDQTRYREAIDQAVRLLEGQFKEVGEELLAEMEQAAEELRFEKAAELRDRYKAIELLGKRQKVVAGSLADTDVVGFHKEGFPAYLASKLSAFYERAGMMHNLNGSVGSVTIIGAVSPQGSDFSEPVTQNTKRFVRCFWGLDKSLAYARHFPAIHWLTSYSEYVQDLAPWYNAKAGKDFIANRNRLMAILNQESALMEIVKLIGSDVLPDDQKLTLEIARVVRLGYLQQNAFHKDDTCVPIEKQAAQMRVILYLYDRARSLVTMGHPMSVLKQSNIFDRVINIKYDVPNDRLDMFDQYMKDIDTFYDEVIEKNA